ncbi:MAG: 2,3-bisphosphoglycerate-independent phosphoglycerate mutase [Oscillospiraceae bacterium]|jgi:2,3-bisphosphoglycerate-independent phosphoglycerate mutase|nr:2,3-bisphosphoglycerate-independent phosphoglycerate mutase [Oscillospiraceae bacterium]
MSSTKKQSVILLILDGVGVAGQPAENSEFSSDYNALRGASTPFLDALFSSDASGRLKASGGAVGLPDGQMGNSEVGHTTIGAGRIIYQDLARISNDVKSRGIYKNAVLRDALTACAASGKKLHFLGLLSDGGVHSHVNHLKALCRMAEKLGVQKTYIHAILDGRDVPPKSGTGYIKALAAYLKRNKLSARIATVVGRFYAMDRDTRWERVQTAYNCFVHGVGKDNANAEKAVLESYAAGVFDEFVEPIVCDKNGLVSEGDTVVFFNFRPDRARELTDTLANPDFAGFDRGKTPPRVRYVCMTEYDERFYALPNISVAYPPETRGVTLGEAAANAGKTQLRIAETEKYAHVTFFLNGGREEPFPGEDRILIPSPKEVKTYDEKPEMSAFEVAERLTEAIASRKYDLIVCNLANGDMVGHTGVYEAAVRAVETLDTCVKKIADAAKAAGAVLIVTADHGNCEVMRFADGSPMTSHTSNLVPAAIYGLGGDYSLTFAFDNLSRAADTRKSSRLTANCGLADLAPTILGLLGAAIPEDMTGRNIIAAKGQ